MKFIHTGDWHLGLKLGIHELADIQFAQVERILNLCEEHGAEALVVAGDVFEKRTGLATLTKRLTALLKPYIERGLHVILISGNHDTLDHLQMMRELLALEGQELSRLRVIEHPEFFEMCGVQWGAMPYPDRDTQMRWAREYQETLGDDRDGAINLGYARKVAEITSHFDGSKPAVFIGHVTVAGVKTPSENEISYAAGLRIGTADLPKNVDYIALGHIHQPQRIGGGADVPCYYSGDLDRYNRGERNDPQKGVYLVEVAAKQAATATWLPLPTTPFLDIEIDANDVEELPARYPNLGEAFVHVTLDCSRADDAVGARRRVQQLCGRVLACLSKDAADEIIEADQFAPHDWRQTTLEYVAERFEQRPDLQELNKKTLILLEEVENALKSR